MEYVDLSPLSAGVTIITHGLSGNVDDWVISMAAQMSQYYRFPGTNYTCYELYFTMTNSSYVLTWARIGGSAPAVTGSAEILIKLDWRQLANNNYSTYQVAAAVVPHLLQTNFISELGGHALGELPIHLIGHSRGGSLVCEMSRLLGTNGVWVDHLTTLDPHPLNNDIFDDTPFYTVVDAPARTYDTVLFHDNYYQNLNFIAFGEPVIGAYVRELINLDGGYDFLTSPTPSHADVHLWYHGTVDLRAPSSDSVALITSSERQTWWTPYEDFGVFSGFYYSLIGGGNRLSADQPDGPGTSRIRDGYNQLWDLGAGVANNRTALPSNNGNWPNLIKLNRTGTNLVAHGQTNAVTLYFQWARPATSNGTISIYLDDDFNPYNGNERLVRQVTASGTTANQISFGTISFNLNATNAMPGVHSVYAKVTGGGRTRYLYAPELLTVVSSFQPPRLDIAPANGSQVRVDVTGIPGQRFVLQSSLDFQSWQPVLTNWLATNRWSYFDNQSPGSRRFYRAALQ